MNMKRLNRFLYDGGLPVAITLAYILIGVFLNIWHPTWLLFFVIPCYYMLAEFLKSGDWNTFPFPILCVILYLAAGFDYGWWHPMWVIFLTIPIFYIFINTAGAKKR